MAEIKAYVWNEGEQPAELPVPPEQNGRQYDFVRNVLCDTLRGSKMEYGKLVARHEGGDLEILFRAFDDEHRGRQVVSATTPQELAEYYARHREFCAQKVFTPNELYALKPVRVDTGAMLYHLVHVHFRDEIDDSHDFDWDKFNAVLPRLEARYLADECPDGRRTWTLGTVWIDNRPFMVVNSSGRDGDEYYDRWVTDAAAFGEAVSYLRGFLPDQQTEEVSPDKVIPGMTEFYSATLHDHYDVAKQAKK